MTALTPASTIADHINAFASTTNHTFKKRAYIKAARTIRQTPDTIFNTLLQTGSWNQLDGIGTGIKDKINAFLADHPKLPARQATAPKPKSRKSKHARTNVEPLVQEILRILTPAVDRVDTVGSYRRGKQILGDLEILVTNRRPTEVRELLQAAGTITFIRKQWEGPQKSAHQVSFGPCRKIQLEVRFCTPESWGAHMLEATGSREHNIMMRGRAKRMGMKLIHTGLWKVDVNRNPTEYVAGRTEEDVFNALGLQYVNPEKR